VISKVVDGQVLQSIVDGLHARNQRIVFTNGCFDILHSGHVRYLTEARRLGDCLIVGINSDSSVRNLKGNDRPYIGERDRAEMLAGLECVDYVTIFDGLTASDIISEICPNVYAKGGDIVADQIPEAEALRVCGAETVILSKVEGMSTSDLASRIKASAARPGDSTKKPEVLGMIPARLAATRLPNKPLLDIAGKPMIQWVYERACGCRLLDNVYVATPDVEIVESVERFGGKAILTSHTHKSGTDRLCEAARKLGGDIIVNIQGDEPLLDSQAIDELAAVMLDHSDIQMASLMCEMSNADELDDPSVVKVVTDRYGDALYFSRSRIPFPRDAASAVAFKHVGIYAYRKQFLLKIAGFDQTPLEKAESLEQLRALEHGYRIRMVKTQFTPTSVDTPEDLARVRRILGGES